MAQCLEKITNPESLKIIKDLTNGYTDFLKEMKAKGIDLL